ncbi:MAG: pantoate--beta-alanine ligase [Actinobacteria bacterium]|nr:pantoate--beta-alanine ligase [Actinomycetota bacterium]
MIAVVGSDLVVFDQPAALARWSDLQRQSGKRVAIVPTMGALHDGHLSLVAEARRRADVVIVSIFVNPLQFDRRDDFDDYPRSIDDDLAICRKLGVDVVYAPVASTMYPDDFETHVEPGPLGDVLEGPPRPGHFRGVTTVVAKLFGAARPHVAIFGEKDYQQLRIIRRMAIDLDMQIEVVGAATVREPDGLAMSSRNRRLSSADRIAAVCVPRALAAMAAAYADGDLDCGHLQEIGRAVIAAEPRARLEQLTIVDADSLAPLSALDHTGGIGLALIAVWFGEIRLIDNRRFVG